MKDFDSVYEFDQRKRYYPLQQKIGCFYPQKAILSTALYKD